MNSEEFRKLKVAIYVLWLGFGAISFFLAWQIDKIRHVLHM